MSPILQHVVLPALHSCRLAACRPCSPAFLQLGSLQSGVLQLPSLDAAIWDDWNHLHLTGILNKHFTLTGPGSQDSGPPSWPYLDPLKISKNNIVSITFAYLENASSGTIGRPGDSPAALSKPPALPSRLQKSSRGTPKISDRRFFEFLGHDIFCMKICMKKQVFWRQAAQLGALRGVSGR